MNLFRDHLQVFEETIKVFFAASNIIMGAEATQTHISGIPALSEAVKARITYSHVNTDFVYANGRLIDVGGALFRFSVWSRDPNTVNAIGYDIVRAANEWPPIFRIDDIRNLLSERVQTGATATGTPSVDITTLDALNTALDGADRDSRLDQCVAIYDFLQGLQDDLENVSAARAQMFLDALDVLRGRVNIGMYFEVQDMGDSARDDVLYDLDYFEKDLVVHYVRSD